MASTIATARGTTQGSCRPLASRMPSLPVKSTAGWGVCGVSWMCFLGGGKGGRVWLVMGWLDILF